MKYNKLIGVEQTAVLVSEGYSRSELLVRRSGRTLSLALLSIAEALNGPGKSIRITDHVDTPGAHANMRRQIEECIQKMGLLHFEFRSHERTMVFNLYGDDK